MDEAEKARAEVDKENARRIRGTTVVG